MRRLVLAGRPPFVLPWEERLGADPRVIGDALVVDGHRLTIAGVAPRGFEGTTLGTVPRSTCRSRCAPSCSPGGRASTSASCCWRRASSPRLERRRPAGRHVDAVRNLRDAAPRGGQFDGHDPAVVTAAVVLLAFIAVGAGYVPATRASRIDPMRALRYE